MAFRISSHILSMVILLKVQTHCQVIPTSSPDCSSCYKGLAGLNGIPGPAGNNGFPGRDGRDGISGRDGLKGDPGLKGDKGDAGSGERGPPGPEGPEGASGERGESGLRGLPGKVGPSGPIGLVGSIGPPGLKGDVGMKGENGSNGSRADSGRTRESAFAVYKTGSQTATATYDLITFDAARVNIGGHFDLNSNHFVCQIKGTYFFSYSAHVIGTTSPDIVMKMDGNTVARARSETVNTQVGSSTMLELEIGNQVWLQFLNSGESIDGLDGKCLFSGFLLYEH